MKSFPHFCYFYYSSSITLLPMRLTVDTNDVLLSGFQLKEREKEKQFRNNRTMLVLKITIRLQYLQKNFKIGNFHTRRLYFYRMGNCSSHGIFLARDRERLIIQETTSFSLRYTFLLQWRKQCRFWVATF
jgi:hypothetical protein